MQNKNIILKELKQSLKHHFTDYIKDVILFGSRADETSQEDSDYDILIVLNHDYDWQFGDRVSGIIYDIELKYDIIIDDFLISADELKNSLRGAQPVFVNAIQNGEYA